MAFQIWRVIWGNFANLQYLVKTGLTKEDEVLFDIYINKIPVNTSLKLIFLIDFSKFMKFEGISLE